MQHKLHWIRTLLETYPSLPFILIGDSGEADPEIYLKATQSYPGRIAAIYIRDVAPEARDRAIPAIAEQVRAAGSEMLLVRDTVEAAIHAASRGFIRPDTLLDIREERREDQQPPTPIEQMLDSEALG
jgi:phosphatidate phosphatase APP1